MQLPLINREYQVFVVYMTNGDYGSQIGFIRLQEALQSVAYPCFLYIIGLKSGNCFNNTPITSSKNILIEL